MSKATGPVTMGAPQNLNAVVDAMEAGLDTGTPDFMNFLKAKSNETRISGGGGSGKGITVTGMIVSGRDKGLMQFPGATKCTYEYTLVLDSMKPVLAKAPVPNGLFKPLPDKNGLRFLKSKAFAGKAEPAGRFRALLERYYASVAGVPPHALDAATQARINMEMESRKQPGFQGGFSYTMDFNHPAFAHWTGPELNGGDVIEVDIPYVDAKPKPAHLFLAPGTIVTVTGLHVSVGWKKPKATTATTGDDENAPKVPLPVSTEDVNHGGDGGGGGENQDEAALGSHEESMDTAGPLAHLREPDGSSLTTYFPADTVVPQPSAKAHNNLSFEHKLNGFVCAYTQEIKPIEKRDRAGLFCPYQGDVPSMDSTLERGLIFNLAKPNRYFKDSMVTTEATNHLTYLTGPIHQDGPAMPVRLSIFAVQRVSDEEVADGLVPEKWASQYDQIIPSPQRGFQYVASEYTVSANCWSNLIYTSGIATQQAWADVNAHAIIPGHLVLSYYRSDPFDVKRLQMNVLAAAWRTKEYLLKHAFQVPHAFAHLILGNGERANLEAIKANQELRKGKSSAELKEIPDVSVDGLDFGSYKNYKKWETATNVGNTTRGNLDLLNATESVVELAPYVNPANGWIPRVLMVPNKQSFMSSEMEKDDREELMGYMKRIPSLKTPEEGQAFIEEYIQSRGKKEIKGPERFGYIKTPLRVLVWFMKPDSAVYSEAALATPYWKTQLPKPVVVATATTPIPMIETVVSTPTNGTLKREHDKVAGVEAGKGEPPVKRARVNPAEKKEEEEEEEEDLMDEDEVEDMDA